jgi:hypothetical protein
MVLDVNAKPDTIVSQERKSLLYALLENTAQLELEAVAAPDHARRDITVRPDPQLTRESLLLQLTVATRALIVSALLENTA